MRDCIFLLADKNMQAAFEGFLTRPGFYQSIRCGQFDFDPRQDVRVAAGDNDPGLFTRGHELLSPFQSSHHRAIVVLDAAWGGSPGVNAIKERLSTRITSTGWQEGTFQVIVIDPELENWIWQKNNHVACGLGYANIEALMAEAVIQDAWPNDATKPTQPKEALEAILQRKRIPRSSAIYKKITSQVSIRRCRDGAFQELLTALQTWFPPEDGQ